ncbi:MAG TPA: hypothetical protein VH257_15095, partial [Chloroflexota bacterium]|nr:hypothetical protein [Chloroflexota bacterium]
MAIAPARPLTRPEPPQAPASHPPAARRRGLPLPALAAGLALEQYNVAFHQPQPPGYPLYV